MELSADAGTDGGSRDPSAVSGTDFAGGWAVGNGRKQTVENAHGRKMRCRGPY